MKSIETKAQWIWAEENTLKNDRVVFRKSFQLEKVIEKAEVYISIDTKYWLYVNGQLVQAEGGLFRESMPGCGYADIVDIAPYLVKGNNVIALLGWYYGNEGRNNIDSGKAGVLISCDDLSLYSDDSFVCLRHPAYYTTGEPSPSYLYGGHNEGYDASKAVEDIYGVDFDDSHFKTAVVYENECWGDIYERPIPPIKFGERVIIETIEVVEEIKSYSYKVKLPCAMALTPWFSLDGEEGQVISICTDRYTINGGPGGAVIGQPQLYNGHRIEYRCVEGLNTYESMLYLFGEEMIVSSDQPIKNLSVGYRESGYDCEIDGSFECDCEITNKLVEKAARTLYVCMRDNFMDCPDRERGQWIGDVSVQVPQTFFLLDNKATALVKKSISDFINLRKGDVLVGNVPGANFSELPAQSLNAISEIGLVAEYYKYTADKSVIEMAFEPCINYLKLWEMGDDGLVVKREGNWAWYDHLFNIDEAVIENSWYYSALGFAQNMASILDDHRFDEWLAERRNSIASQFDNAFWQGKYYSSGKLVDDRANALAVLVGLCKEENYHHVNKVLVSVFNSTVYMETYVLMALCEMGRLDDAYKRMVSRYYNLAVNENSTLWEDFFMLGTKNHAWSGSPATIAFKYFMGIDTVDGFKTMIINPDKTLFKKMSCNFTTGDKVVSINVDNCNGKVDINEKPINDLTFG